MKIKRFWTNRSGAVVSEFVVLTAALVMGVSATLTTLTTSLGVEVQAISEEISLTHCGSVSVTHLNRAALSRAEC